MSQVSPLATYLLSGLNAGRESADSAYGIAHGQQALDLQRQHLQMQQQQQQLELAREHAAQQGLIARYDELNPAPPGFLDAQGPPDAGGNMGQLPNPDYANHMLRRQAIAGMPAQALQGVVGQYEDINRSKQIADYHEKLRNDREQAVLRTLAAADKLGHSERNSKMIAGLKWVMGTVLGYHFPMQTTDLVTEAGIDHAYKELGIQRPPSAEDVSGAMQHNPAAMAHLATNPAGGRILSALNQQQSTAQRADAAKLRAQAVTLRAGVKPTLEEAQARAGDIMGRAGIADPENHPAFGLVTYKIQSGKDIDQKTAERIFGDTGTGRRIVMHTMEAMARDAGARMHTADGAVNRWRQSNSSPVPPQLEAEQREARRAYETAHDRWEAALGDAMKPPAQPNPTPQPAAAAPAPPAPAAQAPPTQANPAPPTAPATPEETAWARAQGARSPEEAYILIQRRRSQQP